MADLITLEEYKDAVAISGTKDDARLAALITSVSTLIKTYCGRSFVDNVATPKVEEFSIVDPQNFVQLSEFPIIAITSVEERGSISADYTTIDAADYYVDTSTDSIYKSNGAAGYSDWSVGPGSVKITYTAGFADVPEDLKLAAYDLVTYYHKDEYKGTRTLAGASMNSPSTSTQWGNVTFPDHIKRVLDLYKNFL